MCNINKIVLSFVFPCLNEANNIDIMFFAIKDIMSKMNLSYECIFVDDGSTDNTLEIIKRLSIKYSEIKFISFTRNFGQQNALIAGLKIAKGEAVVSLDCDMQNPPDLIPEFINYWKQGYKIVTTSRTYMRETNFFKRKSSEMFYKIFNFMTGLKLENGSADFRLLDRSVVDLICLSNEKELFLRGIIDWYGFKQKYIKYVDKQRYSGRSNYSLKRMIHLALNGIMAFSIKPLRVAIIMALFFILLCFINIVYVLYIYFFTEEAVAGWSSLTILIQLSSAMILFMLGVIGEYLGKLFLQIKNRPNYIINESNCDNKNISDEKF